jgi:hypothetical protein
LARTERVTTKEDLERQIEELEQQALASRSWWIFEPQTAQGWASGSAEESVSRTLSRPPAAAVLPVARPLANMPDVIVFYAGGRGTEFPGTSAIALDDAPTALAEFFSTGTLPGGLDWRET